MSMVDGAAGAGRILYLVTDPISTRLLRGQLAHLAAAGFDVELATAPGPGLEAFARSEGVAIHEVPFVREPDVLKDLRALAATIALVRRRRPQVVNASTPKAGLVGMLGAFMCRVPVRLYVVRGLRFETLRGRRRSLLRLLERVTARCATHVVFNSVSLRTLAEQEGVIAPGRGIVFGAGSGNGVDVRRFSDLPEPREVRGRLGLPVDAFVIGFVGRFVRDKGFVDLVDAFERVATRRDDMRLLVVGDYEAGDPIDHDVRDRVAADQRIVTTGWVSDPADLFAAMDVLAFPSYREGLPNGPLEAQAAGVPVVGYAATGTVDAVRHGETGVLVAVGDVAALSTALSELADDPCRSAALGAAGRAWVREDFDPHTVWKKLERGLDAWLAA